MRTPIGLPLLSQHPTPRTWQTNGSQGMGTLENFGIGVLFAVVLFAFVGAGLTALLIVA